MSVISKLFSASIKLLLGQWTNSLIILLEGALIARAFGSEGLGVWATLQAIFLILSSIFGFRTVEALTRHLVRSKAGKNRAKQSLLVSAAMLVDGLSLMVVAMVGVIVGVIFGDKILDGMEIPLAVYCLLGISFIAKFPDNTWVSVTRMTRQFWRLAGLRVIHSITRLLILVLLWLVDLFTINSLVFTYAGTALIVCIYQFINISKWMRLESLPPLLFLAMGFWGSELRDFRRFLRAGFLTTSLSGTVKNADILILGALGTNSDVGLYRIGKSLAGSMQSLSSVLSQVIFQDLSEWIERGMINEVRLYIGKVMLKLVLPFTGVYIVGGYIIWYAIPLIYGAAFESSRLLFFILLVGMWVSSILFWVTPALLAMEKLKAYVLLTIFNSLVALFLYAILTPIYGAVGTAIALSSTWAVGHLSFLIYLYMRTNILSDRG